MQLIFAAKNKGKHNSIPPNINAMILYKMRVNFFAPASLQQQDVQLLRQKPPNDITCITQPHVLLDRFFKEQYRKSWHQNHHNLCP